MATFNTVYALLREALDNPPTHVRREDRLDQGGCVTDTHVCAHCGQPLYKEIVYPYLRTTRIGDHSADCWLNRAAAALRNEPAAAADIVNEREEY